MIFVFHSYSFLELKILFRKEKAMGRLRDKMKKDMELKNLSERTIETYLKCVKNFVSHYGKSPEAIEHNGIREFLYYLLKVKNASQATINQHYSALKFFYQTTLGRDWDALKIPRSRRIKKLPVVLSKEEVRAVLREIQNLKYKALLMTIYSGGLRLGEAIKLKVADIDSQRMMIRVCQGKGNKDRYTLLGERALKVLRIYWKLHRPKDWLFPSYKKDRPIGPSSVQKVFHEAVIKTRIKKRASVHTLRHSFATHLLEEGVEIPYIQNLLGHSDSRTTSIYLHVARKKVSQVISPIDLLEEASTKPDK
jgi:site-specific recombinase XerD